MNRHLTTGLLVGTSVTALVIGTAWAVTGTDDGVPTAAPGPAVTATVTVEASAPPPTVVTPGTPAGDDPTATYVPELSGELPSGDPVTCPAETVVVGDADELTAALAAAQPGDTIRLEDATYSGNFIAAAVGTAEQPIFLCGGPDAVLDGGDVEEGYVMQLDGAAYWRLVGFTVRNGQKGVMADATTQSVLQGLVVEEIGDEAIHLRTQSTHNVVLDNTIRDTGNRRDEYGEGVYVGTAESNWAEYNDGEVDRSDYNLVQGNDIADTGSESVDIKEGTTGGAVVGNTFDGEGMSGADSWVDIKGSGWLIAGNTGRNSPGEGFQTHHILDDWGSDNVFTGNVSDPGTDGEDFYIHDPDETDNEVRCDNTLSTGDAIASNVDCTS